MAIKLIHNTIVIALLMIGGMLPIFLFWSGTVDRWILRHHEKKMIRLRATAMKYIAILHKTMIEQHYSRQQRRQFWREFVSQGRFEA